MDRSMFLRLGLIAAFLSMSTAVSVHAANPVITDPTTTPAETWVSGNGQLVTFTTTDTNVYGYKIVIKDADTPTTEYSSGQWNASGSSPYNQNIMVPNIGANTTTAACVLTVTTQPMGGGADLGTGSVNLAIRRS